MRGAQEARRAGDLPAGATTVRLTTPSGISYPPPMVRRRAFLVLAIALVVRIVYQIQVAGTACLAINLDPISDMETFHRWALTIAGGDWLGIGDFHPFHPWQEAIASEKTWLAWYGPHVFHQDPLYPYSMALIYLLAPRVPMSVILVQHLLGVLTAVGVYLLGRRLVSELAGLAAGLTAAVYGPFLFYESLLLRDAALVPLTTAFLLCLEEARERQLPRWWLLTGCIAGAIYLTKPNILIFLPLLVAWILLAGNDRKARRSNGAAAPEIASGSGEPRCRGRLGSVGALAAGFVIALAPAVARNVIVGAPPLKTTTRGAIEFINGNSPYHPGVGWFDGEDERVTAYAREILTATRLRLLPTIAAVAGTWRENMTGFVSLQLKKLAFLLAPYEMPNNESYAYFRMNVPILRWGAPTFYAISPLAALGLIVTFDRRRRLLPHYLFLIAGGAATVAFYVIGRFRIPYMPLILVFAGAGMAWLIECAGPGDGERRSSKDLPAAGRRFGKPIAALGLVGALLALNSAASYPDEDQVRPVDFIVAAEAYLSRGETARAVEEIDRGRGIFPEFAPIHADGGRVHERAGDAPGALAAYRQALAIDPSSVEAREGLRRVQR